MNCFTASSGGSRKQTGPVFDWLHLLHGCNRWQYPDISLEGGQQVALTPSICRRTRDAQLPQSRQATRCGVVCCGVEPPSSCMLSCNPSCIHPTISHAACSIQLHPPLPCSADLGHMRTSQILEWVRSGYVRSVRGGGAYSLPPRRRPTWGVPHRRHAYCQMGVTAIFTLSGLKIGVSPVHTLSSPQEFWLIQGLPGPVRVFLIKSTPPILAALVQLTRILSLRAVAAFHPGQAGVSHGYEAAQAPGHEGGPAAIEIGTKRCKATHTLANHLLHTSCSLIIGCLEASYRASKLPARRQQDLEL
ncbi:hypothetical protein B0I35DRAFT_14697 [Stachybotrys elegans]|uniref:Uncharacterized protein n=1 Tax=Stachybotrys elegans TaxID=80388 RepID=A0A8K0T591_9HYPO|nr:hypothetical protein B0I35DRAFT_14697 [Stachybotrys elegans]